MRRLFNLFALLLAALTALSCSDLHKSTVVKTPIESSQFNAGCELKVDEFKDILKRDISYQIDCLSRNLDLFMRVVESGRPGYLSRTAFENYVVKHVPDFKPQNVKAIKAIFDLSHLLFGGDPEYINPTNVRELVDFVFLFNREAIKVYPLFASTEEGTAYNLHRIFRDRVYTGALNISTALLSIYRPDRGGEIHKLDIIELMGSFTTGGTGSILEKIKAALFVKRLFLGGERTIITHIELKDLLNKLVSVSPIVFDAVRLKYLDMNQKTEMEMLQSDLERVEPLLYYTPDSSEKLFSLSELAEALAVLTESDSSAAEANSTSATPSATKSSFPDFRKYPNELLQLKMLLTTTQRYDQHEDLKDKEWFLPQDVKSILDKAKDVATRAAVFHRIYDFFKVQLASPASVNIDYKNYLLQFPTHEKYVKDFARIVNNYRFFRGPGESPYYAAQIHRSPEGIVEVALLEFILDIVINRYGEQIPGKTTSGMDLDHFEALITIFKDFLFNEKILLEGRHIQTAENLTLLSTLFQYQSNGDSYIETNEMAELAGVIISAYAASDFFRTELNASCKDHLDTHKRITDLTCYRQFFFGAACRKYKNYMPRFFQGLGITDCSDVTKDAWLTDSFPRTEKFLKTLESVARTCTVYKTGEDVPVGSSDYMPMWVMMLNIEATMTRYDVNLNNLFDKSEVRTAYSTAFHSAVEALVKEQAAVIAKLPFNLGKSIAKKIYYYLIKYGAAPKKVKDYLKLLWIGASPADRQTIAAVLKVIGEQGTPSTFDCEKLRNPED